MNISKALTDIAAMTIQFWEGDDCRDEMFSSAATKAVGSCEAFDNASLLELQTQLAMIEPIGVEHGFGEPSVVAWSDSRFRIELSFWHVNTTTVHDHAFSGAFRVVKGAALENTYLFSELKTVGKLLAFGRLTRQEVRLLTVGSVSEFQADRSHIHGVLPLIPATCILTVRTHRDEVPDEQREFLWPDVAFALGNNAIQKRRAELLDSIARNDLDLAKVVFARSATAWGEVDTALILLACAPSVALALYSGAGRAFEQSVYMPRVVSAIKGRLEAFTERATTMDPMRRLVLGISGIDHDTMSALAAMKSQYGAEHADLKLSEWLTLMAEARPADLTTRC